MIRGLLRTIRTSWASRPSFMTRRALYASIIAVALAGSAFVPLFTTKATIQDKPAAVVACAYGGTYDRAATDDEKVFWQQQYIQSGNNPSIFAKAFFATPDGAAVIEQDDFTSYTKTLYQHCMQHEPTSSDIAYWKKVREQCAARDAYELLLVHMIKHGTFTTPPVSEDPTTEPKQPPQDKTDETTTPTTPTNPTTPPETTRPLKGINPISIVEPTPAPNTTPLPSRPFKSPLPTFEPPAPAAVATEVPCAGWSRGGSITPLCRASTAGSHLDVAVVQVPGTNVVINKALYDNFVALRTAANARGYDIQATPGSVYPTSGSFRSEEIQQWLRDNGYPAAKGVSNHQWGLAIDIRCNGKALSSNPNGCHTWMKQNAGTYGLYAKVSGEPWHYSTTGH